AQLLDLSELIERMLELRLDVVEPVELCRFHPALIWAHHGELLLGELVELGKVRFDDLVQVGGAQRAVADAGEQSVGPGLEQLLAMPGKLELALELLVGDTGAAEITVRFANAPISERRRRERHSQQQARGDQELGLVAHQWLIARFGLPE